MYAKKITAARQNAAVPVFAEHARVLRYERQAIPDARLAPHPQVMRVLAYPTPAMMNSSTTPIFTSTTTELKFADSRIPRTSSAVTAIDQERGQVEQGRFHLGLNSCVIALGKLRRQRCRPAGGSGGLASSQVRELAGRLFAQPHVGSRCCSMLQESECRDPPED